MGKIGGSKKSNAKTIAARKNIRARWSKAQKDRPAPARGREEF